MSKDFWLYDELNIKKVFIRSRSSCLEEYIVRRDLELGLSKFEKIFDPIILVEKHSRVCSLIETAGIGAFVPIIFGFSALLVLLAEAMFPEASSLSLTVFLTLSHLGLMSLIAAFFIVVIDGLCIKNCIEHMKQSK